MIVTYESAKLLSALQHTGNDECPPVPANAEQLPKILLNSFDARSPPVLSSSHDPSSRGVLLLPNLPLHPPKHKTYKPLRIHPFTPPIHPDQHSPRLLLLTSSSKISRRLRHKKQQSELHRSRQRAQSNHPPPPMHLRREQPAHDIRHDLASGNEQT